MNNTDKLAGLILSLIRFALLFVAAILVAGIALMIYEAFASDGAAGALLAATASRRVGGCRQGPGEVGLARAGTVALEERER
ncbi:hypothetical protein LCGC14_1186700 [marine sediment metagenome]|uniref:Uncharacterized protein n=1 Tax=marine sediment metagenome TaxID=412755 RepID=A0A0F9PR22_9ZZZZ